MIGMIPTNAITALAASIDGFINSVDKPDAIATPISSAAELASMSLNGSYYLTNDIDLSGYGEWKPIGTTLSNPFTGTFDGQGYTIKTSAVSSNGLIVTSPSYAVGLFGVCDGAEIKNVNLQNVSISVDNSSGYILSTTAIDGGNVYAGSIAGYAKNTTISNCHSSGSVKATASGEASSIAYAGGLVGYASGLTISDSYSQCMVDTIFQGALSGTACYSGGLVGYFTGNGSIICSYNSGTVSTSIGDYAVAYSGGIVGDASTSTIQIVNCFNEGSVIASTGDANSWFGGEDCYAGGIVGSFAGMIEKVYNSGSVNATVTDAYEIGSGSAYAGGICGKSNSNANISNSASIHQNVSAKEGGGSKYQNRISYSGTKNNNVSNSNMTSSSTNDATSSMTVDKFEIADVYQNILGWDFDTIWEMVSDKDYPQLKQKISIEEVSENKYMIIVQDSNGEFVPNAQVTYDSQTGITDENGRITFERSTSETPFITVICDGYHPYSNENINSTNNELGYEIIKLYSLDESSYMLSSAIYQNTTAGIPTGSKTNLLVGTKRLSLTHTFSGGFQIECAAITTTNIANYQIWQGQTMIAESIDGKFSDLKISDFSVGSDVFIRVNSQNGEITDTPINLIFVDSKYEGGSGISILDEKISITIDGNVPFLGGMELSIDIPDIPVEFRYIDDKFYIGVNVDSWTPIDVGNEDEIKQFKDIFKKLKETVDKCGSLNLNKKQFTRKDLDTYVSLMKEKTLDANLGVKGNVSALGYGEGKWDEDGFEELTIYIAMMIEIEATFQGPTYIVGIVPITYSVEVTADGKYAFQRKHVNGQLTGHDITIPLSAKIEPLVAIGISDLIGVGIYGSGKLDIEFQVAGISAPRGVNYIDLAGELGIKAYINPFEYKHAIAYSVWHLYTRTNVVPTLFSTNANNNHKNNIVNNTYNMYDEDAYAVSDLSYLSDESDWYGTNETVHPFSVNTKTNNNTSELTTLLENTYRNSQPNLALANKTPVMVFTRGNTERGTYNAAQLVYSIYAGNVWSEPIPVDSDNTGDSNASFFSDNDGNLWLIYQNASKSFADNETIELSDYAAVSTIVAAKYDTNSNTFVEHTVLSTPNIYASRPEITVVEGIPTAIWVENTNNDYFGTNTTNTIYYAQYENGSWGNATLLADNLNAIVDMAIGQLNNKVSVSITTDGDNDFSTVDYTLSIYSLDGSQTILSTQSNASSAQYAILPNETTFSLFWSENSTLKQYNGTDTLDVLSNSYISNGFTILSDRIVYNAPTKDGSALFAQIYDNTTSTWSNAIQLTNQGDYLQSYSAVEIDGTTYLVAIKTEVTITEEDVEDNCTLCWTTLENFVDVELLLASIEQENVKPYATVPVTVALKNNGDSIINHAIVQIFDTEGKEVASKSFNNLYLTPSNEIEKEIDMTFGNELSQSEYTVSISVENDSNNANNSTTFITGYSDLSVNAEFLQIGQSRKIVVQVFNEGASSSSGKVYINADGENTSTIEIPSLAPNQYHIFELPVNEALLNNAKENLLSLEVVSDLDEYNTSNNSTQVYAKVYTNEQYTITYDANGGNGTIPSSSTVSYNSPISVATQGDLHKEGYTFGGWNTKFDGSGDSYEPQKTLTVKSDITLYAVWLSNAVSISSISVDGIEGIIDNSIIRVELPCETPVLPTDAEKISIVSSNIASKVSTPITTDNGATWTFTVTAESGVMQTYTMYVSIMETEPLFIPVTNITGMPSVTTVGTEIPLNATIVPSDATYTTINWDIKNAGTTGAIISGSAISITGIGTVTVTATIKNGVSENVDYTQDFVISVIDDTYPTGEITVATNNWKQFLNTITFGIFFKETQSVTISADNSNNENISIQYYLSDVAMDSNTLSSVTWENYTNSFNIEPNNELIIYAKLTDASGNTTYISSNGIVLDSTAPIFSLTDGQIYTTEQTLEITDAYLNSISYKLNDVEQTIPNINNTKAIINLTTNGTYIITATDKAGNIGNICIYMNISDENNSSDSTSTPDNPSDNGNTSTPDSPSDSGNTSTPDNPSDNDNTSTPDSPSDNGNISTPDSPSDSGNTSTPNNPSSNGNINNSENTNFSDMITIPILGEKNSINVLGKIEDKVVNITNIDIASLKNMLNKEVKNDMIEINLSDISKEINAVNIPVTALREIANATNNKDNVLDGLCIKLSKGIVELNSIALTSITEQAKGDKIKLVVKPEILSSLNANQMESIKDMKVITSCEAYFISNGERIGNFNGGKATVKIPYTMPNGHKEEGYSTWYVAIDGTKTKFETKYDKEENLLSFQVNHFSHFVVIYDVEDIIENEETTKGEINDKEEVKEPIKVDTTFRNLRLRNKKSTKTTNKLIWNEVENADGYVVYGNQCNTKNKKYKMLKQVVIKDGEITTWTDKKLKQGTYYKYYIKAYKLINGKKVFIAKSKTIHVTTLGGKYGNAKTIKVKDTNIVLKKNQKFTINATVNLDKKIKVHTPIKFETTNSKVAIVNKNGVIKAKKIGNCTIYVYAQNGMYKKIKVTVTS